MRNTLHHLVYFAAATLIGCLLATADDVVVRSTTVVAELEDDIRLQEEIAADKQDSIDTLTAQITILRAYVDSLNTVVKATKADISALEKRRKAFQNEIKTANKTRKATFASRDHLVFAQQVKDVLEAPYNKQDVEQALLSFNGMETKEVLKKRELVENYGKYSLEVRNFLENQKNNFSRLKWVAQPSDADVMKKFQKGFKALDYYKIYERGRKKASVPTIPYLDDVMSEIEMLQHQGMCSEKQYNRVLQMLYQTGR